MREIKFRAWVEKFPDGSSGYLKMQKGVSVGNWFSNYQLNHPEYFTTLEQFTGLKDKNGNGLNELYEGDIISDIGEIVGNVHEGHVKRESDFIIEGMGISSWRNSESEAIRRGFGYAE